MGLLPQVIDSLSNMGQRVLLVAQGLDGGIASMSSLFGAYLAKKGVQVRIVYVGRPAVFRYGDIDQGAGVRSVALVTGKGRSVHEAAGYIRTLPNIAAVAKSFNPCVTLLGGFVPTVLYARLISGVADCKVFGWDQAPQRTFLALKRVLFVFARRHVDAYISVSESCRISLSERFGVAKENITVIPNAVDPLPWQKLKPAPPLDCLRIVMPARIDLNQKDHKTLLQAVQMLREKGIPVLLKFVGGGVDAGRLESLVRGSGHSNSITLEPHSNNIPAVVEWANVVCLSTKFEGLPLTLVEGMLARRLIVTSRVEGCCDVIDDNVNGFLFEQGNVEQCAEVLRCIQTRRDTSEIVARAYDKAMRSYTPEVVMARLGAAMGL